MLKNCKKYNHEILILILADNMIYFTKKKLRL